MTILSKREQRFKKAAQWLVANSDRTDDERALSCAAKIRLTVDMWELIRLSPIKWFTVYEVSITLGIQQRQARRFMKKLAAAGLAELRTVPSPQTNLRRMEMRKA